MMKTFLLLVALTFASFSISTAQILCIYCYQQNDSISAGVNNLLLNGDFEITNCPPSTGVIGQASSFCPNSAGYVCNFQNWTCTGGGSDTYACLYNQSINKSHIAHGNNAVYMGNFYANACSPVSDDISCLVDLGCTVTGIPSGYPTNTFNFGGNTGVSIKQTVSGLTPGQTYVLEFWAGGEQGYATDGLFGVDVGFGDTLMRDNSTDFFTGIGRRFIIEFNATASSHTIKFTNWGHICSGCSELVLDDVKLYTLAELSPGVPACAGILPQSSFAVADTQLCEKFCTSFTDLSTNDPTTWQWIFAGGDPATSSDQNPSNICYSNPGTYDVTLITTNANGSDTLTLPDFITVYPTPPIPVITQSGSTLTCSAAASYQWQLNNVDIPGATNQSYDVPQSGYYTVVITDANGCVSSSANLYVLLEGIEDVGAMATVFVYPNPSDGNFIIELNGNEFDEALNIRIYNVLGQQVFYADEKNAGTGFKKEIDLCGNTAHCVVRGVYLVEISSGNSPGKSPNLIAKKKILITE